MKPKLYQYAACPFCSKVAATLRYKGVDFETIEVHPLKKKEIDFSPDYRAVPIYIDSNGKQVNDSTPIMRHIDQEFTQKPVFETTAEPKAREERWLTWSEDYVQGLPTVVYGNLKSSLKSFSYVTKVGKFSFIERLTIQYSGALIMTLVAKKIKKRRSIEDPKAFLRKKVSEWSEGLEGRPFMGGDKPNGADMAVFGISRIVANLEAGKIFNESPAFMSWFNAMSKQTGLAAV
jgi:microsomal prostaglandin-E synthase 2